MKMVSRAAPSQYSVDNKEEVAIISAGQEPERDWLSPPIAAETDMKTIIMITTNILSLTRAVWKSI